MSTPLQRARDDFVSWLTGRPRPRPVQVLIARPIPIPTRVAAPPRTATQPAMFQRWAGGTGQTEIVVAPIAAGPPSSLASGMRESESSTSRSASLVSGR